MSRNCCVLGCVDRGKYCLPYDNPGIWKNWLKSCPYFKEYTIRQLECNRICSRHFIPEHFDINTNSLTKKAVPLLNLPMCSGDEPGEETQTDDETKGIQAIDDSIEPSDYSITFDDESIQFDTEECIPIQQLDVMEFDPLKLSPIDFDDHDDSVAAYSPPPELNPVEEPPQFIEYSECSTIIKPQPMKVPRVVLHRLPPNLQRCRVCPPPPMVLPHQPSMASKLQPPNAPKPQPPMASKSKPDSTKPNKQNDDHTIYFKKPLRDSIMYYNLKKIGSAPKLMPATLLAKLKDKELLNAYRKKLSKHPELFYPMTKRYLSENKPGQNLSKTFTKTNGTASEGGHYTTKEKIFALSLLKICPKGYDFLKNELALPWKSSVDSILNDIPLRPGINEFIFQTLADAATHKTEEEKECALLFGEMKIDKFLKFNAHTGIIEGLQDLGSGKHANNLGDKALVFMLCGLFQIWKLPIAYYFTGDLTEHNNVIFQKILSEVIMAVFETGFVVKATISDHSSKNVEAINTFLADNETSEDNIYYEIGNKLLFHIYDVTNILKYLKKNSRNDDQQQNRHAKWDFIETLFQVNDDESEAASQAVNRPTEVEFWDSALRKLLKFDLEEGQTTRLLVDLVINNVNTIKKVLKDRKARGTIFVRRLNLKPLYLVFRKIRERYEKNINSNQFIKGYRCILINNLISAKAFYKSTALDDDKILSLLNNLTSSKKFSSYYDDVDLEMIMPYVKEITTELPVLDSLCTYFVSNMPYKDCTQCQQSILSADQSINLVVWKSINLVDEMLPEMVNFHIYPLMLILRQEIDTTWYTCAEHKTQFFRILWVFIIKIRTKKWCSYFNVQKGYTKSQFFIPKQ